MTIASLTGIGGTASQSIQSASDKLQAVLASIASGSNQSSDNIAETSIVTQLQSQASTLKQVSGNLTQALSLAQVADGGAGQIQDIVSQLQSLASQAESPVLNADNRKQLNQQFQQLSSQIGTLASSTSFNGQNVLDGSLSGANALSLDNLLSTDNSGNGGDSLSISSLSTGSLFSGQNLSLLSSDNAAQALAVLGNALNQVTNTRSNIGAFQQAADFAAANVDSALANQQAAQSAISDTDIAGASTNASLANIQQNAAIAVAAQANRLNPALLQLVG